MSETSHKPTDEELVLKARANDISAFETLVERYFGMVLSIAYVRLKDRGAAEDLTQEVFLRAFLHLDAIREPERFSAWLGQVTRNLAFHWQKKQRRFSSLIALMQLQKPKTDGNPNHTKEAREQMEIRENTRIIRDALFQLPAGQAEVVLLRFGENIKPPEIGRRLDLHPTTVRRRLKKALATMKDSLPHMLEEVAPLFLQSREAAIRTVRMAESVAVLSPLELEALSKLSAGGSERGVWGTAMPLRSFYYWAYETTPGRIIMPDELAGKRYDITLETFAPESKTKYSAMQELLARESGLVARWETREVDVYVLSVLESKPHGLRAPEPLPNGWRSFMRLDSTRGSKCLNSHLMCLVIHLEENLDRPVVDETRLDGEYDWEIAWLSGASFDEINHALQGVGLELTPARRRVDMLVLEKEA